MAQKRIRTVLLFVCLLSSFTEAQTRRIVNLFFEPEPKPKVDPLGKKSRSPSFIFPIPFESTSDFGSKNCTKICSGVSLLLRRRQDTDIGELCLQSGQCISRCCHRASPLSLARCAPKATEFSQCSPSHLHNVYYYCPCESGLDCDVDGSIANSRFGICKNSNKAK